VCAPIADAALKCTLHVQMCACFAVDSVLNMCVLMTAAMCLCFDVMSFVPYADISVSVDAMCVCGVFHDAAVMIRTVNDGSVIIGCVNVAVYLLILSCCWFVDVFVCVPVFLMLVLD